MGDLKRTYSSSLSTVKEMFPNWTDEDIIFALQETEGDLQATIERISEGVQSIMLSSLALTVGHRQHLTVG